MSSHFFSPSLFGEKDGRGRERGLKGEREARGKGREGGDGGVRERAVS